MADRPVLHLDRRAPRAWALLSAGAVVDIPGAEGLSPLQTILKQHATVPGALILIGVSALVSRGRPLPRIADRAPARAVAAREVAGLWLYALAVIAAGQALIPGDSSLHLHGSVVGGEPHFDARVLATWAPWNFVTLAAVPFLYFHRRRRLRACRAQPPLGRSPARHVAGTGLSRDRTARDRRCSPRGGGAGSAGLRSTQ